MTAAGLPPAAAALATDSRTVIIVRNNCRGFWEVTRSESPADAALLVAAINAGLGVMPAQSAALFAGSMWGHDVPAADPASYDDAGHILHH